MYTPPWPEANADSTDCWPSHASMEPSAFSLLRSCPLTSGRAGGPAHHHRTRSAWRRCLQGALLLLLLLPVPPLLLLVPLHPALLHLLLLLLLALLLLQILPSHLLLLGLPHQPLLPVGAGPLLQLAQVCPPPPSPHPLQTAPALQTWQDGVRVGVRVHVHRCAIRSCTPHP